MTALDLLEPEILGLEVAGATLREKERKRKEGISFETNAKDAATRRREDRSWDVLIRWTDPIQSGTRKSVS